MENGSVAIIHLTPQLKVEGGGVEFQELTCVGGVYPHQESTGTVVAPEGCIRPSPLGQMHTKDLLRNTDKKSSDCCFKLGNNRKSLLKENNGKSTTYSVILCEIYKHTTPGTACECR